MELDPRIRIRAPLRCDGIGRLDCAEDAQSGARLAVRWLPLEANGDAAVKACARLPAHPTLPRIHQTGQVGGSAFVALDFPEGKLLAALEGDRLDTELVLRIAGQLADALATVHAQGVVHGELSADSVLLADGRAYLWDMPLVIANRLTDRRGEHRLMQNLVKTAAYLAPERARGEGASQAADVFSLAAVLCAAAGALTPSAPSTLALVHQVSTGAWQWEPPAHLPQEWREMLTRMLSADPAARPTASEVALTFTEAPASTAMPTVPEFPAVVLPDGLVATQRPVDDDAAMRTRTREVPLVELAAALSGGEVPSSALEPEAAAEEEVLDATAEAVRIPTAEIRAVAPRAVSVALTDSVAVAPELAAGAVTLSAGEVAALRRQKRQLTMVLAVTAMLVTGLLTTAFLLATQPAQVVVPERPPAPMQAREAAPVAPAAVEPEEDELAPLIKLPPKKAKAPARAQAPAGPPVTKVTMEPLEAPAAPTSPDSAADFSFLEGGPAPKQELKRPEL
jgi:hypothetical protein